MTINKTQIIEINSSCKEEIIDITSEVNKVIKESRINNGICIIYCPHTTAGITINENYDPDVKHDIILSLNNIVKELNFKHSEGNSSAHVKSSLMGKSQTIIIENNEIVLGTWDGIYFCEFDGPRKRKVLIKIIEE